MNLVDRFRGRRGRPTRGLVFLLTLATMFVVTPAGMAPIPNPQSQPPSQEATLWLGNDHSGDVFETGLQGNVLRSIPAVPVTGIAWDGDFLYMSEYTGRIVKRDRGNLAVLWQGNFAPATSGVSTEDMAWDSARQRLWRIDKPSSLRRFKRDFGRLSDDGSVSLALPRPGAAPLGVAYDPRRDLLYVSFADDEQNDVLAGSVMAVDPNSAFAQRELIRVTDEMPGGLAYDAATDRLWMGTRSEIRQMTLGGSVISRFTRPQPTGDIADGLEFIPAQFPMSISPGGQTHNATGGSGSIAVTASSGQPWTVIAPSWITITSGGTGNGNGTVTYTVAANTGAARSAQILIGNQAFTVIQADSGSSCAVEISPAQADFPGAGGVGTVNVTAMPGCSWFADIPIGGWIHPLGGVSGSGSGILRYYVELYPLQSTRSTTILIGDKRHQVNQSASRLCSDIFASVPQEIVPVAGGSVAVPVVQSSECQWFYALTEPWMSSVTGGWGPFSGPGTFEIRISANPGPPRTGGILIGGHEYSLVQAGPVCPDGSVGVSFPNFPDYGSCHGWQGYVEINAPGTCGWLAVAGNSVSSVGLNPSAKGLTVAGIGGRTINLYYEVEPNPYSGRSASIILGNNTLYFPQKGCDESSGDCAWSSAPPIVLQTLRQFRDTTMARTQPGREYTELYYRLSPEAIKLFVLNPALFWRTRMLLERSQPIVESILRGKTADLNPDDVEEIDRFLDGFESIAGGELKKAIQRVRRDAKDPKALRDLGVRVRQDAPRRIH